MCNIQMKTKKDIISANVLFNNRYLKKSNLYFIYKRLYNVLTDVHAIFE